MTTILKKAMDRVSGQTGLRVKPDRDFYNKVGINQKRFGQLLRGDKPIYGFEAVILSEFFGVPLEDLCKNERPAAAGNSAGQSSNA